MLQSFKLALKSIYHNKMRSFLTMLGIIIGVASVIILVSIVNAYMSYMTESFTSMGTNQITVRVTNLTTRSVSESDFYEFFDEHKDIFNYISPTVPVSGTVKYQTDTMDSTLVTGVSEDYLELKDYQLQAGRNIQYADLVSRQKVCVAGSYVAAELFGSAEKALDQTIKIGGSSYKIVGIVEQQDQENYEDGATDDFLWIPYRTAMLENQNSQIENYVLTVADLNEAAAAKLTIESYLQEQLRDDSLYRVTAMSEMLDSLNSMITMLSAGLGGIAGISLLVAGVGVMNIMLVSVTERTREIGIRKALGAKKRVILQQFVIEASMTSSLGGVIGILIGSLVTNAIGQLTDLPATPTPAAVIISFSVSVAIGLFFGYAPASRAAKLNPIDALRSE